MAKTTNQERDEGGEAVLTAEESGAYKNVNPETVRRAAREGRLPYRWSGSVMLFLRRDLDTWQPRRKRGPA